MSNLTRYLAIGVINRSFSTLLVLLFIYTLFDLIELQSANQGDLPHLISQYAAKLPLIIVQMLPFSLAIGSSLTFSVLRKRGEWLGATSLGASPYRLAWAMLIGPLLSIALSISLSWYLAPMALNTQNRSDETNISAGWIRQENWFLHIDSNNQVRTGLSVPQRNTPTTRFERRNEKWKKWTQNEGWHHPSNQPVFEAPKIVSSYTPLGTLPGQTQTLVQLLSDIDAIRSMGQNTASLKAELGLRIVLPLSSFLAPLLTLLINLRSKTQKAVLLISHALLATTVCWITIMVLWNGILFQLWSTSALAVGAPLLYLILGAMGLTMHHVYQHCSNRTG